MADLTKLFPENVIDVLEVPLKNLDASYTVVRRPLRPSDPNPSIGIFGLDWEPIEYEIGGTPDPSISRYNIGIQTLVKAAAEEEGQALHTHLAFRVRTMLYRSTSLRVSLRDTKVDFTGGIVERVLRWGISNQRFRSNEISGQFVYLAVTNFWIETETNG